MAIRPLSLTALLVVAFAATFAFPEPVDARGRRRNYADEWEREEREEERREERERARREYQEAEEARQKRYIEHSERSQDRRYQHHERQLDRVLDTWDGGNRSTSPAAPAPRPKKSGTCIYGEGDKILYQPDGVVCSR